MNIKVSPANKYGNAAPCTGFWLHLKSGEVSVWRWNKETEDLESLSSEETYNYSLGVRNFEFDTFLGAYPMEKHKEWVKLTCFISPQVLTTLEPIGKKISPIYDENQDENLEKILNQQKNNNNSDAQKVTDSTSTNSKTEMSKNNKTIDKSSHIPYFTDIPSLKNLHKKIPISNKSANEITKLHLDKSDLLKESLLRRYTSTIDDILGELQFCFICFLMGQSLDAFEQWKKMLSVLCSCDSAMQEMSDFFCKFIATFMFQLQQVPEDLFVDIVSGEDFISATLKSLFELLEDDTLDVKLRENGQLLKDYAVKRFGKRFKQYISEEFGEDAPVIVDQ